MKPKKLIILSIIIALLAVLTVSYVYAQGEQPPRQVDLDQTEMLAGSDYIPIQGRLTDQSGNPLTGTYNLTFRLYAAATGGVPLCSKGNPGVVVDDGFFVAYMSAVGCPIDGRQLYLGIEVGSDGEMTPRQYIDNVPYAWSLRPGAVISATLNSSEILNVRNTSASTSGLGLKVQSSAGTAIHASSVNGNGLWASSVNQAGVHGASGASAGVEGFSLLGPGVYGESLSGVAIAANGVITSSAETYLWISGNDLRPFSSTDSTIFNLNSRGGVRISRGAVVSYKNVVLPVTIAGTLYGQEVRITDLDLYWKGDTDWDAITTIRLRRQTGVCNTCYQEILANTTDHVCWEDDFPSGCTIHNDLTTHNVLSSGSGIVFLTFEIAFNGPASWIDFDGARLTLVYDR